MNPNKRTDNTEDVFQKEFEKLRSHREILQHKDISPEKIIAAYAELVHDYESLLSDAVKITRIGDLSQLKLLTAKEKIEDLNTKLVESERNVRELNTILMFYIKATDK
jgi:predicted RNase H-like nuclease (RuvC/YqgF family)